MRYFIKNYGVIIIIYLFSIISIGEINRIINYKIFVETDYSIELTKKILGDQHEISKLSEIFNFFFLTYY